MENSKKSPPTPDPSRLRQAVEQHLARLAPQPARIALAYSGGIDSSVLLHRLADTHRGQLIALHIHHGLSANADDWLTHCAAQCAQLGVAFAARRLQLAPRSGDSLEAVARKARYAALEELCAEHGAQVLITAHHAQDQAETVLLNLLRGAGIAGLAGMATTRALGAITLARPLLDCDVQDIHAYAREQSICHIEDESNANQRHTRNAIRHTLMPVLRTLAPGATLRLAATARHAGEAQLLLNEIGADDLQRCAGSDHSIEIAALLGLSGPRAKNVLRLWLRQRGVNAPSEAALANLMRQLADADAQSQMRIQHDSLVLHAYRGRLRANADPLLSRQACVFQWQGETSMWFADWQGSLHFEPTQQFGMSAAWLRAQALTLTQRTGGERLKLHPQRPTRSLKNLYQENAVPPVQRERLPLLRAGTSLIWAAGLGTDAQVQKTTAEPEDRLVNLVWKTV